MADLTPASLMQVWPEVLARVGGILQGQLERGVPAISAPKTLVLSFAPEYTSTYQNCSLPENVQRVEAALLKRTGLAWAVRLERTPGTNSSANGHAPPAAPRLRPQEAMQRFPLLKQALDVFQAIPMALDPGFGDSPPAAVKAAIPHESPTDEA